MTKTLEEMDSICRENQKELLSALAENTQFLRETRETLIHIRKGNS